MSYFSERKGLKCTFVYAALSASLACGAAYSHIEEDQPNPMAMVFTAIFAGLAGSSYKEYRRNAQEAKNTQNPSLKP